jgi:hypothetical protein
MFHNPLPISDQGCSTSLDEAGGKLMAEWMKEEEENRKVLETGRYNQAFLWYIDDGSLKKQAGHCSYH